jgi:GAF domain-containing protein
MLARVLLRDNDSRGVDLRERLNDVRPMLLARRIGALGSLALAFVAFAGWVPLAPTWQALLIAVAVTSEAEIISVCRAPDMASLDRRLAISAFAYASVAGIATFAAGGAGFAGALAFALVLAGAGTALNARPLFAVTAYSLLLFGSEAIGEFSGIIPAESLQAQPGGSSVPAVVAGHDMTEAAALMVAVFILPAISVITYGTTQRLRTARRRAEVTAAELRVAERAVIESREQLKRWNEQLEEQNRDLAAINAVSFALNGPMDETGAVERASRLIARVLDVRAAQLYLKPTGDRLPQLMVVAADPNAETDPLAESFMRRVADDGEPLHEPTGRPGAKPLLDRGQPSGDGDAFAIVPLVAKGRTIGSFAVLGERPQGWNDHELHLLVLIGRELGMALENERLYEEALDSVAQETLLSDVVRTLVTIEDAGRALSQALDLVASRIGARFAAVITRPDGALRPTVLARYANGAANDELCAVNHALLAAPSMVADRTRPLVLGDRGEGPVSSALAAEGIGTFVLVPIVCASPERDEAGTDEPQGKARTRVMQTMTATLAVAAGREASWGQRQVDLLSRLSSVIARRMETDNLLTLQERRITELSGLAEVAATVQSTIDPERLYSGFARALHTLADYRRLYVARLDDGGDLTQVVCFGPGGRALPSPSFDPVDNRHAWFGQRGMERWSAGDAEPPSFIGSEDRHGLIVPLRPKGQILGVVVITTREAPRRQYGTLVVQAVEQLALALDSAALYRQATERAARIQVLGN